MHGEDHECLMTRLQHAAVDELRAAQTPEATEEAIELEHISNMLNKRVGFLANRRPRAWLGRPGDLIPILPEGKGMLHNNPLTLSTFGGTRITVSAECYEMVPIFPDKPRSKRRLRRTRGKFGRTERMNPLAYKTPIGMVVHPIIYDRLKSQPN